MISLILELPVLGDFLGSLPVQRFVFASKLKSHDEGIVSTKSVKKMEDCSIQCDQEKHCCPLCKHLGQQCFLRVTF
jgi:hypothetical protein